MNVPDRQSDNCNEVQLKSLKVLERKVNFVTMQNTYSDVSGTAIQGENQLSGTEGWGSRSNSTKGTRVNTCIKLSPEKEVQGPGSQQIKSEGITGHKSGSNLMPKGQQGNLGQRGHSSTDPGKETELKNHHLTLFSSKVFPLPQDLHQKDQRTSVCCFW